MRITQNDGHFFQQIALKQNSVLKIGRAKVTEADEKIVSAQSQYFPQLTNNTKYVALSDDQLITVPAGSLGNLGGDRRSSPRRTALPT